MNDYLAYIAESLRLANLQPSEVAGTFNVAMGRGPSARKANVDPGALIELLQQSDDDQIKPLISGFVSGVEHALLEPRHSKAAEWNFVESAGALMPIYQPPSFPMGVEAVHGQPAWVQCVSDEVVCAFVIRISPGLRVVTADQFERWGATGDRVFSGARSMLFHRTRELQTRQFEDFLHVRRLHAGDGHDAARAMVYADAFYTQVGPGLRFSMPSPDHLLVIHEAGEGNLEQLRAATDEVFETSDTPLSRAIFGFERSRPVVVEERHG
ncbi:hypothetical protein FRC98_08075 [Lujinxingia vulgaris]|uniref:Uncharacterized protein n=1 Tax=Lujinxingia vulgaris TaxID=2600176 RepID=A0A5C6XK04_9DELT|nr:hypothetical protein [Lujinxingia vulgaris]TXD37636.1 hypothetical protein FRC98_08075 [Lujinxingia vulgaris]